MGFDEMMTDRVDLVKKDGQLVKQNIKASVQSGMIFTFDSQLPIEVGDHILRKRPGDLFDDYVVDDPGYQIGIQGIKPHFQIKVHRSDRPSAPAQMIINNISGANARVNIHSTDNSQNYSVANSTKLFSDLIRVLEESEKLNADERRGLIASVERMQATQGTPSFSQAYQQFMALVADHMSIVIPLLPALSQLLS